MKVVQDLKFNGEGVVESRFLKFGRTATTLKSRTIKFRF